MGGETLLKRATALALIGVVLAVALPALAAQTFYGAVQALPPGGWVGTWVVSGVQVQVTPTTRLKFRRPPSPGRFVKVKGSYFGGRFIATEIKGKKRPR
jgi:hypothetical protein